MAEESKLAKKLKTEESKVKFADDEMKNIQAIREQYIQIQLNLGQLSIRRTNLNKQVTDLNDYETKLYTEFEKIKADEKDFTDEITSKYGDGTLDPETGTFIPKK
jgi:hypothetical protein